MDSSYGKTKYNSNDFSEDQIVARNEKKMPASSSRYVMSGDSLNGARPNSVKAMRDWFEQVGTNRKSTTTNRDDLQNLRLSSRGSARSTERRKLNQSFFGSLEEPTQPVQEKTTMSKTIFNQEDLLAGSAIADRKKLFESTRKEGTLQATHKSTDSEISQGSTASMVLTSSELSSLQYDGSLFSEDTVTARDEVEASRLTYTIDNRDVASERSNCSASARGESFEDNLNDLMESFENDTRMLQQHKQRLQRANPGEPEATTQTQTQTTSITNTKNSAESQCSSQVTSVYREKREGEKPIYAHNSTASVDIAIADNRIKETEDPFPVPIPATGVSTSKREMPTTRQNATSTSRTPATQETVFPAKKVRNIPSQLVPNGTLLFRTVDKEEKKRESNKPKKPKQKTSASKSNTKAGSSKTEKAASMQEKRFEFVDDRRITDRPLKGILKHNSSDAVSTMTSNSQSCQSSTDSSEGSSDEAPCSYLPHHIHAPILPPNQTRQSIGACVNQHLADNPPDGGVSVSDASSHCSSYYQPISDKHQGWRPHRRDSVSSSMVAMRNNAPSPMPTDPQYSVAGQRDLQELAETVSTLAHTASTVALDCFVDAADKVVVTPLITIFKCVDASESILCSGSHAVASNVVASNVVASGSVRQRRSPLKKGSSKRGNQPRFRTFDT